MAPLESDWNGKQYSYELESFIPNWDKINRTLQLKVLYCVVWFVFVKLCMKIGCYKRWNDAILFQKYEVNVKVFDSCLYMEILSIEIRTLHDYLIR